MLTDNQAMTLDSSDKSRTDVAERLRQAIKDKGRGTPARLAEDTGVSPQAVSEWQATGRIDRKHWSAIARRLEVREEWLFLGKGSKTGVSETAAEYNAAPKSQEEEFAQASPEEREIALNVIRAMRAQKAQDTAEGPEPRKNNSHSA